MPPPNGPPGGDQPGHPVPVEMPWQQPEMPATVGNQPGAQTQEPPLHTKAGDGQTWPQPPQCSGLVLTSTHCPLQQRVPAAQQVDPSGVPHGSDPDGQAQCPLMHCLPPVQVSPQPEQLTLVPIKVGVQLQHFSPTVIFSPHFRQLASVQRLAQCPSQQSCPEPQQAAGWPSGSRPQGFAPGIGTQVPFEHVSQMLQLRQVPLSQIWQEPQQAAGWPSGSRPQGFAPGIGTQVPFEHVSQMLQLRQVPLSQTWQGWQQAAGWPSGSRPQGFAPGIGTHVPFEHVSQALQPRQVPPLWQTWQGWQQAAGRPGVPPQGRRPGMGTQFPLASSVSHKLHRGMQKRVDGSQTSPSPQQKDTPFRSRQARGDGQHAGGRSGRMSQTPVGQQNPLHSTCPLGQVQVRVVGSQCLPVLSGRHRTRHPPQLSSVSRAVHTP